MDRCIVCLGGTFSPLHRGHLMLLERAFLVGRAVKVGLTTDGFARSCRTREVAPYPVREMALRSELDRLSKLYGIPYTIGPISDRVGFADLPEIEGIVVSSDTERYVDMIDLRRAEKGAVPLKRFVVPMVLDDSGSVLSSTNVSQGRVDAAGRSLAVRQRGGP